MPLTFELHFCWSKTGLSWRHYVILEGPNKLFSTEDTPFEWGEVRYVTRIEYLNGKLSGYRLVEGDNFQPEWVSRHLEWTTEYKATHCVERWLSNLTN